MKRRNFLIGVGGTAIGGSALLGSGAFSRVESQRQVSIEVAQDPDAYLGLSPKYSPYMDVPDGTYPNSENYVDLDEDGHLYVDIGENPTGGQGVNSDSFTWFDNLFELCNNGKQDVMFSFELPEATHPSLDGDWEVPDPDYDETVVSFYFMGPEGSRDHVEEGEEILLELGQCEQVGLRTVTKGVNATLEDPLIDGEVVLTAQAVDGNMD